mmetsp:Transcript_2466/g.6892  ORF Transcript_2466/g.6892 Transcript_2466/m.6892 type:complete len:513 (+) Transcript_2466:124-1662(+)
MVVISAAVCNKQGKILVARQFQEIPRLRIEGLLAAFSRLLMSTADKSRNYIETDSVRYLFQPLEQFYVFILTNKSSNIIEDMEALQQVYKVTLEYCYVMDEAEFSRQAFTLISAYDEVVAFGYREKVTMQQVAQYMEMDSQDERLHEMIERNKRLEAIEEAKRRQHIIEQEKLDAQQFRGGYNQAGGGGGGGYSSYQRPQATTSYQPAADSASASTRAPPKKTQKRGMVLAPAGKKNEFLEALDEEIEHKDTAPPPAEKAEAPGPSSAQQQRNVHFVMEESVSVEQGDGGVRLELKGDLSIIVNDPSSSKVFTVMKKSPNKSYQYKIHPNVDKNRFNKEGVLILRNPDRPLPTSTSLGLLKWRLLSTDEFDLPLSVSCWPAQGAGGKTSCTLECELLQKHLNLEYIEVHIPVPGGAAPNVDRADGSYDFDDATGTLIWQIPSLNEGTTSSSMEFAVTAGADNSEFFPIRVGFMSSTILSEFAVEDVVQVDGGQSVPFSVEQHAVVDNFEVVA